MGKARVKHSNERATSELAKRRRSWLFAIGLAGAVVVGGGLLLAGEKSPFKSLHDLLGSAQQAPPPGALQVGDLAADMKGYQGTIVVRGVVAVASPNAPGLFAVIDSREARVCQDLKCAKRYLPVKTDGAVPKPWDELNIHGKVIDGERYNYLAAERIENLGSIK